MNRNDSDAALAHQQEQERRRLEDELLKNDPDYLKWLDSLNTEVIESGHDEIRRQRIEVSKGC